MYVKKIENRIVFKIRTGYLKLSTTKFLGSNENKITIEKDGENVPHLKIAEAVLAHCNIVTNDYQQNSRVLHTFIQNKLFGLSLDISPKNVIF